MKKVGFPCIVKPNRGTASSGTHTHIKCMMREETYITLNILTDFVELTHLYDFNCTLFFLILDTFINYN